MYYWFEITIFILYGFIFIGMQFAIWLYDKENKDLKCCGNCANNGIVNQEGILREENCRIGKHAEGSCQYCDEWKFDNMQQKDRRIE